MIIFGPFTILSIFSSLTSFSSVKIRDACAQSKIIEIATRRYWTFWFERQHSFKRFSDKLPSTYLGILQNAFSDVGDITWLFCLVGDYMTEIYKYLHILLNINVNIFRYRDHKNYDCKANLLTASTSEKRYSVGSSTVNVAKGSINFPHGPTFSLVGIQSA